MMYHLVLLQFKQEDKSAELFKALGRLQSIMPKMTSYAFGMNSSSEGLNQGFTHAFTMGFTDAAARDAYLIHADHEQVKADFLPFVEKVLVLDFEG